MSITKDQLSLILRCQALILIIGLPMLVFVLRFPGWPWDPSHTKYEWMIVGTYMSLGFFLMLAARNPLEHGLFYDFCIWGAFTAHGCIMLIETLTDWSNEWQHIMPYGDVPALLIMAVVLYWGKNAAEVKQH
jgi:hypothetical protein